MIYHNTEFSLSLFDEQVCDLSEALQILSDSLARPRDLSQNPKA